MPLADLQEKWIGLFHQMRQKFGAGIPLAAPFLSVALEGHDPASHQTILYIGKATRGWGPEPLRDNSTVAECRQFTVGFFENSIILNTYHSAFWRFARRLKSLTGEEAKRPWRNLVWSNIAKLGAQYGNPNRRCLNYQAELAKQTLVVEINEYRPSLVVFVSGDFGQTIVNDALKSDELRALEPNEQNQQGANVWEERPGNVWLRKRYGNSPAFLRLAHPQGKPRERIDQWVEYAQALLPGDPPPG